MLAFTKNQVKHNEEIIDHARKVSITSDAILAEIDSLMEEGEFIGTGHFEDINTGDRFDMVVCPLTNIYNKENK